MRIDINCPFDQKDEAKALGARWDSFHKTWYITKISNLYKFAKWVPQDVMDYHLTKIATRKKQKPQAPVEGSKKIDKMLEELSAHWNSI